MKKLICFSAEKQNNTQTECNEFSEELALSQFIEFIGSASYAIMKLRSKEIEYLGY